MKTAIKKAFHFLQSLKMRKKGYDPFIEERDPRDWQFSVSFKKEIAGVNIPQTFIRRDLPIRLFQNSILSCVSCTCTYINMYYSKKEGNEQLLSWRDLYVNVRHYRGGTSIRENLKWLKNNGQCLDKTFPQSEYYLGETAMQDRRRRPSIAREEAKRYKIKSFYFLKPYSEVELKTAILKAPIGIHIKLCRNWYTTRPGVPIEWDGRERSDHLVSIIGWTKKGYIIADWDNRPTKILSYNYPISSAFFIHDQSDFKYKNMLKPRKLVNSNRLLVILPSGKYQFVSSPAQWEALNKKKLISGEIKLITNRELASLKKDEEPLVIIK